VREGKEGCVRAESEVRRQYAGVECAYRSGLWRGPQLIMRLPDFFEVPGSGSHSKVTNPRRVLTRRREMRRNSRRVLIRKRKR
jgi:hypothetical protein